MFDHSGFRVSDIRRSMALHAAALAPPGLRARCCARCHPRCHPHDHGAFVIDPDGKKVEAVCHAPA